MRHSFSSNEYQEMPFGDIIHKMMMMIIATTAIWWVHNGLNIKNTQQRTYINLSEKELIREEEKNWNRGNFFYDCNKAKLSLNWLISDCFFLMFFTHTNTSLYRDIVVFFLLSFYFISPNHICGEIKARILSV